MRKPKILIFSDFYLPGYKSGGGMRTIVNMVERLCDRFEFWIVTRDHDGHEDRTSYSDVKINEWNNIEKAKVFYLSRENVKMSKLHKLVEEVKPQLIYTNSYFSKLNIYLLLLRKLGRIPKTPFVLAPCGELSDGAWSINKAKKDFFLMGTNKIGLYGNIVWKASTELEKKEIERLKPSKAKIFIAPDLPPKMIFAEFNIKKKPVKKSGCAKMIFLSRFVRKKNFKWLLQHLKDIDGKLEIDIFGPLDDSAYWKECSRLIEKLPENIKVEAKGTVPHHNVAETLFQYDFFILPTLGENFGHVFLEAFAAGCPLIISDQTPWIDLEKKRIGWEISLKNPGTWIKIINKCINMEDAEYKQMSLASREYVLKWLADENLEKETVDVLNFGLSKIEKM